MKGKKRSRTEVETMPASVDMDVLQSEQKLTRIDLVKIILFSCLLFVSMTLQTGLMSMILCGLAILCALPIGKGSFERMKQRFTIPVFGLLLFAVMQGCAAIYSNFGAYALTEFYKFIAAFSLVVILLTRFEKKHVRGLLWGFAVICAVISLLCIDMATNSVLYDSFNHLLNVLGGGFTAEQGEFSSRVNGIYNDANVSASLLAVGALIGLYLVQSSKSWISRICAALMVGISAQGFFLSMSRGAILCFGLALVIWLILAKSSERIHLFMLMACAALVTVVISMIAMPYISMISMVPNLLAVGAGICIAILHECVVRPISRKLQGHGKIFFVVGALLVCIGAGYVIAGLTVTGPYTFDDSGETYRSLRGLNAGTYTVSGDWDGEISARILAQTKEEQAMIVHRILYEGPLNELSFEMPADQYVTIQLRAPKGTEIRSLVFSDGTELALDHPLLPHAVTDRLQEGLFGRSYIMRVQYASDAWKLIQKSPILGHGLGSTEGLYTSVQPFFYQSKFAHNHLLQYWSDTGIIGLLGYLTFAVGGLWILLKAFRKERDGLSMMLVSCWLMINSHSLMEISFSVRGYLCLVLCVLSLPVIWGGEPIRCRQIKSAAVVLVSGFILYLSVFGGLLMSKRMIDREIQDFSTSNGNEYMQMLQKIVKRDVFDHEQMQLTYIANALVADSPTYNGKMYQYVDELRESGTYTACSGLARYYYLPKEEYSELFACSREGIAQEASTNEAWNLQLDFYRSEVFPAMGQEHIDEFLAGVLKTIDDLDMYNTDRIDPIELSEENQKFTNIVTDIRNENMTEENAYAILNLLMRQEVSE